MAAEGVQLAEKAQAIQAQFDRILQSETFRNAEGLRRLFRFLGERYLSGDGEPLKEYTVGVDGLGKPADYDPRQDSSVRIQTGRLRQKLADYFRTEGAQDPFLIELPKGGFKLAVEPRPVHVEPVREEIVVPAPPQSPVWKLIAVAALIVAAVAVYWAWQERQGSAILRSLWTPELEEVWQPFLTPQRPLLIAVEDPPFVQFKGHGVYREMALNRWEDIVKAPQIQALRKTLNNAEIEPNFYYAPVGEVSAAFLVGRLLGPRVTSLSLSRARGLSWQQLASNNVLYIGAAVFFDERLAELPAEIDFSVARGGVKNARPGPGEKALYEETLTEGTDDDGEIHAIITHIPGPSGSGQVTSITSMRTSGRLAAVQWFTDPANAKELLAKLKGRTGVVPRSYQVLLKVKYKDGVPTATTYLLHHELSPRPPSR
jgi:hypothetical protein